MLAPWEESAGLHGAGDAAAVMRTRATTLRRAPARRHRAARRRRRRVHPSAPRQRACPRHLHAVLGLPPSVAESAPSPPTTRRASTASIRASPAAPTATARRRHLVPTRQTKAALAPEIPITKMVAKGAARIVTRQVGSAKEQVVGLATAAKKTTHDTIVAGPALIAGWAINMGWGVLKNSPRPSCRPGTRARRSTRRRSVRRWPRSPQPWPKARRATTSRRSAAATRRAQSARLECERLYCCVPDVWESVRARAVLKLWV